MIIKYVVARKIGEVEVSRTLEIEDDLASMDILVLMDKIEQAHKVWTKEKTREFLEAD